MTSENKETVQYITAITTLVTGIVMCFLSFFLNTYHIESGVLMYFGETLIFCAGVFGINLYVKNQVFEAESRLNKKMDQLFKEEQSVVSGST